MLILLAALLVQDPFPKPGHDPEGVVLDELGKPIAGAVVEVLGEFPNGPFSRAVHQVLGRTPLPRVTTDAEGRFVMPLSASQRSLGTWSGAGHEVLWLVASKPGTRTWREPLTAGLRDYFGSRVVLPTLAAAEALQGLPWPPLIPPGQGAPADIIAQVGRRETRPLARAPVAPVIASVRGTLQLRVRVMRQGGVALPHAWLWLSNSFLEAAEIARARAQTDERGNFEVDHVPESATEGELEVLGENGEAFHVVEKRRSVAGDRINLEIVVASIELRPCRTIGGLGEVVPFAPVLVAHGGPGRYCTLLSDSVGRLMLEGDPTPDSFAGQPLHGGVGRLRSVKGVVEATVVRFACVALSTDPLAALGYEACSGRSGSRGSMGLRTLDAECDRFFVWFLAGPEDALTLRPTSEVRIPITYEELAVRTVLGFPFAKLDKRSAGKR